MIVSDVILFFENIDPDVDIDLIHQKYVDSNMDVLIAMGNIDQGQIVLDVAVYELDIDDATMKDVHIAEEIFGINKLTKCTASKSEVPDEYKDT